MSRPRILDLFCCEGGMAKGYEEAGFEVFGVDIRKQPRYPFSFQQMDALSFVRCAMGDLSLVTFDHELSDFDAIHASPPCQADSITKHAHKKQHVSLVAATRQLLKATGLPYIMENVVGAEMPGSIILCGAAFCLFTKDEDGSPLVLKRHRQFESNIPLVGSGCDCAKYKVAGYKVAGVYGGGSRSRLHAETVRHGGYTPAKHIQEQLMGINWMTQHGLHQAMPPAYGKFIGTQLMSSLATPETEEL